MDALKIISEGSIKAEKPQFNVGDTVRVDVRINRTEISEYRPQTRGGFGKLNYKQLRHRKPCLPESSAWRVPIRRRRPCGQSRCFRAHRKHTAGLRWCAACRLRGIKW